MAHRALGLAEEDRLAAQFLCGGFLGIELAEDVELGRRREVEQVLELGHEVDLAAALQDVDAFLRGRDRIAVEIGGPLLELGEVLDRFQGPLRAEQALDVHAAQRGHIDPVPILLRPDVADEVGGAVGMAVDVAIEAGHAPAGLHGAAIVRGIELLLRQRRQQQPQAFQLLGIEDPLEHARSSSRW